MRDDAFEIGHAEALLDVVFGVVIALPLIDLPGQVLRLLTSPSQASATTVCLGVTALLFSAFYWLEVRHFLAEQRRFDAAIRLASADLGDGVPLQLGLFLIGSLSMMALAAAALQFADASTFRPFLVASALFWGCDLVGTHELKRSYRPYAAVITVVREEQPLEHGWFLGHIVSPYFYSYGAGNLALFVLLLVVDYATQGAPLGRLVCGAFLVPYTVFRHLGWRSALYSAYRRRAHANQS